MKKNLFGLLLIVMVEVFSGHSETTIYIGRHEASMSHPLWYFFFSKYGATSNRTLVFGRQRIVYFKQSFLGNLTVGCDLLTCNCFLRMKKGKNNCVFRLHFIHWIMIKLLWSTKSVTPFNNTPMRNGFESYFNQWSLERCIFQSFSVEMVSYLLEQTAHISSLPFT